jgi:hypothetical protein
MTVLCGTCNAENRDAAKFCKGCGRKIAEAWTQAAPAAVLQGLAVAAAVPSPRAPAPAVAAADPVFLTAAPASAQIGNGRWIAALGLGVALLVVIAAWWGHRNRSEPIAEPVAVVASAAAPAADTAPAAASPAVVAPEAAPPVVLTEKLNLEPAAPEQPQPVAKVRKAPVKKQAAPPPVVEVAAPAPPPPAPEPVRQPSPQESCAGRNFIAHAQCMAAQCARPEIASHAQCEAVRRQQRLEEEKRNPIAN